jgi:hypothetical protein
VSFEGGEARTKSGKLRGRKTPTSTVLVLISWRKRAGSTLPVDDAWVYKVRECPGLPIESWCCSAPCLRCNLEIQWRAPRWMAQYLPLSDVWWRQTEFSRESDSHGDFAAPVWYVRAYRKGVDIEASHRMAKEGNLWERMRLKEVEDILSHCLIIHWSCVRRRIMVVEILRHKRAQSKGDLDRAMWRALGHRPVVEGHSGTPRMAIANSISCHCHTVSRTVSKNAGKNNTHNSPWRMTSGRSVYELCLG